MHKFIVVQAPAGVKLVMNRVFTRFAGVKAAAIYVMRSRKCVFTLTPSPTAIRALTIFASAKAFFDHGFSGEEPRDASSSGSFLDLELSRSKKERGKRNDMGVRFFV